MKHSVYGKHLGRTTNERTQLFRNLVRSLILHESINTTESKAKAIKGLVDKLVTQAKTPATRRLVSQFLVEKSVSDKLVKDIAPRLSGRKSGYTSVVKLGRRLGDGTVMVQMRLLVEESKSQKESKSQSKKADSTLNAQNDTKELDVKVEAKKAPAKKAPAKKTAPKKKEAKK